LEDFNLNDNADIYIRVDVRSVHCGHVSYLKRKHAHQEQFPSTPTVSAEPTLMGEDRVKLLINSIFAEAITFGV